MEYTLTLEIPEEVYKSLKKTAQQTGQIPEVLAAQLLVNATKNIMDDPVEQFIGVFNGHGSDWVDHHDKYIGMSVNQSMPDKECNEI